jgi:large subunit ribosomal protein L18e
MAKRTGPTNVQLIGLIQTLRKLSSEQKVGIWKRIAYDLEMPSRNRRVVNVYSLSKCTKDNENVVVPGKVLGTGMIDHKVNVAAFEFSEGARKKIIGAKGTCIYISDMMQKNPKGQNLRIMG